MNRLEPLDWLRGMLALSIMVYHLTVWKLGAPQADTLLGRLGIYGVSMFFVLSGLAMAAVYHDYIRDIRTSLRFFVRRIFRIWPLLWLAVAAVTAAQVWLKGATVDWGLVWLNLTTLFGFVAPGAYINTGAWSIGNEMVYYALTPFFLVAYRRSRWLGNTILAATLFVGFYFAFLALDPARTLASQWSTYINPFDNLCFYAIGVAIFFNARHVRMPPAVPIALLVAALAVLAAYPVDGDLIATVTGVPRIVFIAVSAAIVLSFFKLEAAPPAFVARPLAALGAATYGVYLLHPIVYPGVELALRLSGWAAPAYVSMAATAALTIAVALALYEGFEAPMIRLGKRLSADRPGTSPAPDRLRASGKA